MKTRVGEGGAAARRTAYGALAPVARACDAIEWAIVRIAALALAVMVLLTTADALARYFLNSPITGAMELTNEFLMPALVFFTMSYVYRMGGHVRVTILSERFPPAVQRASLVLFDAVTAVLFAGLTWGVALRAIDSFGMREYSSSPLGYLLAPSFAIVAIGGALMTVRAAVAALSAHHPEIADAGDVESY